MRILSSIGVSRLRRRFCLGWLPCWPNQARLLLLLLAPGCSVFTQVEIEMLKPAYHWNRYNQCLCVTLSSSNQSLSHEVCLQSFPQDLPLVSFQVMIFLRGSLLRIPWFLCLTLPLVWGLLLCVWAASTCWCLCLSLVPFSSWLPGLASRFTAASCRGSRPWGRAPSRAISLMSRPYEVAENDLKLHTDTFQIILLTIHLARSPFLPL